MVELIRQCMQLSSVSLHHRQHATSPDSLTQRFCDSLLFDAAWKCYGRHFFLAVFWPVLCHQALALVGEIYFTQLQSQLHPLQKFWRLHLDLLCTQKTGMICKSLGRLVHKLNILVRYLKIRISLLLKDWKLFWFHPCNQTINWTCINCIWVGGFECGSSGINILASSSFTFVLQCYA